MRCRVCSGSTRVVQSVPVSAGNGVQFVSRKRRCTGTCARQFETIEEEVPADDKSRKSR